MGLVGRATHLESMHITWCIPVSVDVKASSAGLQNLESTLEPILVLFHQQRRPAETLGDFCARVGFEAIRKYSYGYVSEADASKLSQVGLPADLYKSLEAIAAKQGKSVAHVACEAVRQYVQ